MGFVEKIAEFTDLPKDILCGETIVKIVSQSEVDIAGHRGIISCSEEEMLFYTKSGKCKVCGKLLQIDEISFDSIIFKGKIKSVEFL